MKKYITNSISGIWNSYGCPPEPGAGISLSLEDSPGVDTNVTGSLIDLFGFKRESFDIGVLAETSTIKELVVLLPMLDEEEGAVGQDDQQPPPAQSVDPCDPCDEDPCGDKTARESEYRQNNKRENLNLHRSEIENGWLFKIDENIINKILDTDTIPVTSYKELTIYDIKDRLYERLPQLNMENNIVKTMFAMVNYNIPPHLNWILNKNVPPLAMYTAEYSMTFNKTDLSDIWQGNMPVQARYPYPQEQEIVIEHYLEQEEVLSGYDLNDFSDIKMKVFKCKWRSDGDYNSLIAGRQPTTRDENQWYGYNWPYDYCSIVEYLQVQAGEGRNFEYNGEISLGVVKENIVVTSEYDPSLPNRPITTADGRTVSANNPVKTTTTRNIRTRDYT